MKVFDLQGNNTNFISEMLAGLTSFVTVSYLLVQCPAMIGGDSVAASTLYLAVCFTCFIGCMAMGFWARQPFVIGPSVGLTSYFAATLMTDMKYDYTEALAITFFSAVIFVILSLTGLTAKIYTSLSGNMKNGITAGLGIYITMLGFKNAGFLTEGANGNWKITDLSVFNLQVFTVMVMFVGLILIGLFKKIGLIFPPVLGLIAAGGLYFGLGKFLHLVDLSPPELKFGSISGQLGTWYTEGFLKNLTVGMGGIFGGMKFEVKTVLAFVVTLLVCSLFNATESVGVVYAIAKTSGKLDDKGNFGSLKNTIASNAVTTTVGTLLGCPMVSVMPESSAGISAQGKSGLTAVTAGVLFLLAAFFAPVATYIPSAVTACIMVYIGFSMIGAAKEIDFADIGDGVPALMTMILIPFTSSIIDGIAFGIIVHIVASLCLFKFKSLNVLEIIIAVLFGLHYFYL